MKKMVFILLVLVNVGLMAEEKKEIVIATQSVPGAINRDGSGLYWDIVKMVYKPLGYSIVKKYTLHNEAAEMLRAGNADVLLGSYSNEKEFALYPKYYFDQDVIVAIVRDDAIEEWNGRKSLEGLKVGWIRGYSFDKYLGVQVEVNEFSNRNNGLKLLKNERLDAYIDENNEIKSYIDKGKLDMDLLLKKTILQLKLYPAFAKNEKGKLLSKIWDESMEKLIQTDKFRELYFDSEYTLFPY